MASSSSSQHVTVGIEEECHYPHPSNLSATSFISVKVSDRDEYDMWKTQMECLLQSHGMYGFIDGTLINPKTSSRVSGKEKVGDDQNQLLWTRSDAVVKGWILGSLSKQTLGYVLNRVTKKPHQETNANGFSAKDVWDELKTIYGPVVPPIYPQPVVADLDKQAEKQRVDAQKKLYEFILEEWPIRDILKEEPVTVIDKLIDNGNSALHIAVSRSKKPKWIEHLLGLVPENTQLSNVRNSDGSTPLHVAAIVGNTEAARVLVERDPDLLFDKDREGHTPLALALSNMHTKTSQELLKHINTHIDKDTLFSGATGDELLVSAISSKNFGLANDLMNNCGALHSDAVLMAIAQNFPCEPGTTTIFWRVSSAFDNAIYGTIHRCVPLCGSWVVNIIKLFYRGIQLIVLLLMIFLMSLGWLFHKEKIKHFQDSYKLLESVCLCIINSTDPTPHHLYYTNPIFEATRQNSYEVVERLANFFPNAIWSTNKDGHNIIQYAVITRSENIYNMLYQMSEHKNVYRTMKDSSYNNLLHLAARLAPTNKLNLISGAALQIQRELQWFKEVERFVCPLNIKQKNFFDETPQMVFTREHKDLVIEGEKWMKATAESYTITAALITTIVFAAAITVPGGNNQDTGLPVFTNHVAFTIFAISDAISLFGAVTSLLMFLSILTARFAEQDFLFKLPTKLIIGLATLFISTAAMIVAFGATLYLVFSQSKPMILISIVVLTCLPIISFVTLQFPLIKDLMNATYGRSIFGKRRYRDEPFY